MPNCGSIAQTDRSIPFPGQVYISGIDPRSGHESPQHPVEIMRSGGSDDDDGNVGDETRDGDIGDWVGRERHRRGIGTTAYAAVTFHLVAK